MPNHPLDNAAALGAHPTGPYVVKVCPDCDGQVGEVGIATNAWHDGDCPNRNKIFAIHEVMVVPQAESNGLRDAMNNRQAEVERLRRHIDLAFDAACKGNASLARVHLTNARWGSVRDR